jgi:hypothetical protein
MSENALSPTWSLFAYSSNRLYTNLAYQFSAEYHKFQTSLSATLSDEAWSKTTAEWISGKLTELHLNPRVTSFPSQGRRNAFVPNHNVSDNMYLVELSLESPRSLGAEAVIFTSRFERLGPDAPKPADTASYSWAFLASFVHMVQHQHWRSKDIIIVLSPEPARTRGVEFWIERLNNVRESDNLQYRHSFIIASLTVDIPPVPKFQTLAVKPESVLGTLPNLDLPNAIFRIAYRCDLKYLSWTPSDLISFQTLPWLSGLPSLVSNYLTPERMNAYNTMFSFMFNMALGEPTGDHSVISRYKIEAVTISGTEPSRNGPGTVKKMGEMLEGTLRSLNNLIEPLHQSFYYYIPLGPFIFVPIGHYMISFALLFVPTALWVVLTVLPANSEDLFFGAKTFSSFCVVGLVAFLFPSILPNALPFFEAFAPSQHVKALLVSQNESEHVALLYLAILAALSLLALSTACLPSLPRTSPQRAQVAGALAMTPYLLFLAAAALLNASFALIATILTLPSLVLTLLRRPGPRLVRLTLALATNPLLLLSAYAYYFPAQSSIPQLVTYFVSNWQHYQGLTFPFACLILPMSLHAFYLAF